MCTAKAGASDPQYSANRPTDLGPQLRFRELQRASESFKELQRASKSFKELQRASKSFKERVGPYSPHETSTLNVHGKSRLNHARDGTSQKFKRSFARSSVTARSTMSPTAVS
eukprot:5022584-Pyramimonas_sp.AAC.1